jgi:hypothetical protein
MRGVVTRVRVLGARCSCWDVDMVACSADMEKGLWMVGLLTWGICWVVGKDLTMDEYEKDVGRNGIGLNRSTH